MTLVLLVLLGALLSVIVLILQRQATRTTTAQAVTQLASGVQVATASALRIRSDTRIRVGRIASLPELQQAVVAHDRETLARLAHANSVLIEADGITMGALPNRPRFVSSTKLTSGSRVVARVSSAVALNSRTLAHIRAETPLPASAKLLLLQSGRVLAGAKPGLAATIASDKLLLGGESHLFSSAKLPLPGLSIAAVERSEDVAAPSNRYLRRIVGAALLTLLLACAVALRIGRPIARLVDSLGARAELDPLTRLANRRLLDERLQEELDRAGRYNTHVAFVLLDVDDFKQVNDRHGHLLGDEVLRHVAAVLATSVRELDLAARFGGEEFALVLPGTTAAGAVRVAEMIRDQLTRIDLSTPSGERIRISASLGVAAFPGVDTVEEVVEVADRYLYEAKRQGKNRVVGAPAGDVDGSAARTTAL